MQLRKATRRKAKIRLGLSGPSGFGKTYSALLIARGICSDWGRIAIIDSENGSADLYADLGEYNVLPIQAPFPPEKYIDAIKECEKAGMEVIIIDSISHEWDGKGGCLEIYEQLGGKYQDWAKVTPRHQAFIQAILQSPCHIITTVRRKQDYELTRDNNGKIKVEKAGLKEVTRDGWEYELTVNLELVNDNHLAKASKDRTGLFMDKPEFVPSEKTGELIAAWCESGVDAELLQKEEVLKSLEKCATVAEVVALYNGNKRLVDQDAGLKERIGKRRDELKPKPAPEAEHVQQWRQVLNDCRHDIELEAVYKDNKEVIDNDAAVKALYDARLKQLSKPVNN